MKPLKDLLLPPAAALAFTLLALATAPATAQIVFSESFESNVVSGYVANTVPNNGKWIGATLGYGATSRGLYNKNVAWPATAPFATPYGQQAYFLNYVNSGLTTAVGATGQTLKSNVNYQVTFHTAVPAGYTNGTYRVELVAFGPADDNTARTECRSGRPGAVLAFVTGSVTNRDMSNRASLAFTPTGSNTNLGKDLGIRLLYSGSGSTSSALYDNVRLVAGIDPAPSPEDGVTLPAGNVQLSWANLLPNVGSDVYVDVWFGTNAGALTKVVSGGLNATNTTVSASVAATYYWRVDSYLDGVYPGTPVTGTVFKFYVTDADTDGIPDAWTQQYFGHPTGLAGDLSRAQDDADNDGLTNLQEYQIGTNPVLADTDGDGLSDGGEIAGAGLRPPTDPRLDDTDGDGLRDGVESNTGVWTSATNSGTNPFDPDTDQDGLKDGVETNTGIFVDKTNTGTDPFDSDSDNDGVGDWYEVTAVFTDPNNSLSLPDVPYPLPDPDSSTGVTNKPVKVYILSGQSNMTGIGRVYGIDDDRSLENITIRQHRFPNLIDSNGVWIIRQDVTYQRMVSGGPASGLTAGQGSDSSHLGPELGFGQMIGWYHDEPVLLLKSSQGNRSLGYDILPPISPAYEYGTYVYAGYGQTPGKWLIGATPTPGTDWAGREFDRFFLDESEWGVPDAPLTNVVDVLDNFATQYPQWAAQGFQIAGFVWWQGDKDRYDMGLATRYETNLVNLIQFLRSYYTKRYPGKVAPNAPFVLGTLGQTAFGDNSNLAEKAIFDAQMAVDGASGKYPQFAGNVKTVYTHPLSEGGASNDHYGERAGTYMLVSDALGRAMIDLRNIGPDTNAPFVWSLNPANGATNFAAGANLVVKFNENIALGTGNIILTNLTDGTQTTIAVTNAAQVSVFGNALTINPTANLTPSKQYAIRMEAGTVQDLWTNAFAGITNDITWNFTNAALDLTAPTLFALSPTNSATDVSADVNLVATFSEPIARGTGTIIITNLTDGTQTTIGVSDTAQVSISGTTLTINPTANLTLGKQYAVRIAAGAVKDLADNPFAGILNDSTWSFTTEPPAATYYWDNNGTSAGFGTAGGTWSSGGSPLWNNDSAGGTVAPSALGTNVITRTLDNMNFGTGTTGNGLATGTITISGTVNAGTITFGSQSGTITLSGGTINFSNSATITVNNTHVIDSLITGASTSLTKAGGGTLRLSNTTNNYTGATLIGQSTGGILEATALANGGVPSSIGVSSSAASNLVLSVINAGVLRYIGATNASTDRLFTLGNQQGYAGGFEVTGTGTLNLTSTGAVAFAQVNSARIFSLGGTNTGQNILNPLLVNNGTATLSFIKNGAGNWVVANTNNSYTGSTTINGGTLSISNIANYGVNCPIGKGTNGTAIVFNGGTLNYTAGGDSTDRLIQFSGNSGTILNNGTGALNFTATGNFNVPGSASSARTLTLGGANGGTLSGTIQNNTGTAPAVSLTKAGTGTWTLSGTNTYSGATTVSNGTLRVNGNSAAVTNVVTVLTNATFGGAGTVGGIVRFRNGSRAQFTVGTPMTFTNAAFLTNVTVKVDLGTALGNGDYMLATNHVGFTNSGTLTFATNSGTLGAGGSGSITNTGKTLILTVTGVSANAAPVAYARTYGVPQYGTLVIDFGSGANALATDADGNPLKFVSLGNPNEFDYGTAVTNNPATSITYTNTVGTVGAQDVFSYIVTDGAAFATNLITVRISPTAGTNQISVTFSANTGYLTFQGMPGTNYVLEWSPSLSSASWTPVQTNRANTNPPAGYLFFEQQLSPSNSFFRMRSLP